MIKSSFVFRSWKSDPDWVGSVGNAGLKSLMVARSSAARDSGSPRSSFSRPRSGRGSSVFFLWKKSKIAMCPFQKAYKELSIKTFGMPEKELLTRDEITKKVEEFGKGPDAAQQKIGFLKSLLRDEAYKNVKKDIINSMVVALKEIPTAQYRVIYDSIGEGLEPLYFWILDFMRDQGPGGIGLDVFKGPEDFEASVASGYFSEVGQKATQMQAKAMEYFGAINQVIKSLLNLIYDLKEFEMRINMYDKMQNDPDQIERKNASSALKGVWMDQVDMKKGKGSINLLAQDLGFVTIRDAFFYADTKEQVEDLDLNERVKNILRRKFSEYNEWLKLSEKEIKKRYAIEKAYLKSQYATLKLYASWLKPYLMAAQKLKMKQFNTPDIVNAFSNIEIHLSLLGQKEMKPEALHASYKKAKLPTKYYAVLEAEMILRGMPSAVNVQGGRQYVHGGRADIRFKAYAMDEDELGALKTKELYDDLDLVDDFVGGSLKELQEEIDTYINPVDENVKPAKSSKRKFENPFKGTIDGLKELTKPVTELFSWKSPTAGLEKDLKKHAGDNAAKLCFVTYNLYKKLHGMLSI